jgi:2-oxoglutarate dehydrogenase E1 component
LQENVISAGFVKELEEEYKAKLDENLEASRKKDLTVITPFMENEWEGYKQVSDDVMLQKFDTKFDPKDN